jgi:capsular exopolysaccharide synthesis family protein
MEIRDYLSVLRVRWKAIVACALVGLAAAVGVTIRTPKTYEAQTSLFLSVSVGQSASELSRGFSYAQGLVNSYAQVATQPVVLAPVISQLGLDTTPGKLAQQMKASAPLDTVIIDIVVRDESAKLAADIANRTAAQLRSSVADLVPTSGATTPVDITVVSPATVPDSPSAPRIPLNLSIGLLLGTAVGVLLALARDAFDARIRTRRDVSRITDVPVIGSATVVEAGGPASRNPARRRRQREADEHVKELRTNFQYMRDARLLRTVAFTSAMDDAPVARVVAGLGRELARVGVRTLLVDADLRQPVLSRGLQMDGGEGLSTILAGEAPWPRVIKQSGEGPLYVLPAGPMPREPSLLLDAAAMSSLVGALGEAYDVVLVKSPPVLRVADGLLQARVADGAVVVTDQEAMNRDTLAEEVQALEVAGADVLGIVLST